MIWSYEYQSKEAIHRPTKLAFSITYDPMTPDRKVKLTSKKPAHISDAEVAGLIQELQLLIQDRYLQSRMRRLLDSAYDRDFDRAAHILERQTKKKVSTRTLQAWMMPPGRPSSRRCPEWAVAALEDYLARNPEAPRVWKDVDDIQRSTPEGQAIEREKELRDRNLLRNAEDHIARQDAIWVKWRDSAVADIPARLTELEISVLERIESHSELISQLLSNIRTCDTFEDFKPIMQEVAQQHYMWTRRIKETALDIRELRKEFAADDGTLPNETH